MLQERAVVTSTGRKLRHLVEQGRQGKGSDYGGECGREGGG